MAGAKASLLRTGGAGVELRVRLTPKGGKDAVDGLTETPEGPALKARVRAAPEDGEANAALVSLIADWLGLPKRDVVLASGHKSRTKVLRIAGAGASLEARVAARVNELAAARVEKGR